VVNANWPTVTVEVCFNVDPADPAPPAAVWTAITPYVVAWAHQAPSGRQHELGRTEAATVAVLLNDQDGRFDPSNTASPYWPNVLPYRQLRIRATWSAVTYDLVRGYVERWPQRWDQHKAWAEVVVVDALAPMAQTTFRSCYDEEVLADAPIAYYPLSEPDGTPSFGSVAATAQPQAVVVNSKVGAGTVTAGEPSIVASDPASCVQFAGGTAGTAGSVVQLGQGGAGPFVATEPYSVELWFQAAAPPGWSAVLAQQLDRDVGLGGIAFDWFVQLDAAGHVDVGPNDGTHRTTTTVYADNKPHHVLYTIDGARGYVLYVDGAAKVSGTAGAQSYGTGWVDVAGTITGTFHQAFFNGLVGHVAIYPAALTAGQALAHYQAGATAFAGELSGARFARLLRYAGYVGPSAVDAGLSQMAAAQLDGQSAPEALKDVADAENGTLHVAGDGTVTFRQRSARYDTAATATLGELETPYLGDVRFDFDPTFVYNLAQVTRPGGITVSVSDQASRNRYFLRTLVETPQISSDLEAADRANYRLAQFKDPHLRLPQVTVDPASNPGLWPVALGTRIGDRVAVRRRPFGAPALAVPDCFVEAVGHDVDFRVDGPPRWRVTYLLSPADTSQFWLAGDATYSIAGVSTVPGY